MVMMRSLTMFGQALCSLCFPPGLWTGNADFLFDRNFKTASAIRAKWRIGKRPNVYRGACEW
jgi:hypothetical protein